MCQYFPYGVQKHSSGPTGTRAADLDCAEDVPVLITCRVTLSLGFLVSVPLFLALLPDFGIKTHFATLVNHLKRPFHCDLWLKRQKKHLAGLNWKRKMRAVTTFIYSFLMTAYIFHALNGLRGSLMISDPSRIFYGDLSIITLIYWRHKQEALWDFLEMQIAGSA